jgi:hypothetical protein
MNIREYVKTISIILMAIGILCLPIGFGASPKRDTSVFSSFADLGIFLKSGLIMLALGLLLLLIGPLIPSRNN